MRRPGRRVQKPVGGMRSPAGRRPAAQGLQSAARHTRSSSMEGAGPGGLGPEEVWPGGRAGAAACSSRRGQGLGASWTPG